MSNPHFASLAWTKLTRRQVWRIARPVLILLTGVAVGAVARTNELRMVVALVVIALMVILLTPVVIMRVHLAEHPTRVSLVAELEVLAMVTAVTGAIAALVNAFAWLAARFADRGSAYLLGLMAGAILGYLSKDLFKVIEDAPWFGLRFNHVMWSLYQPYFYGKGETGQWEGSEQARWLPNGAVMRALDEMQFKIDGGEYVGWDRAGRRTRAEVVRSHLVTDRPWNPNPNGEDSGSNQAPSPRATVTPDQDDEGR